MHVDSKTTIQGQECLKQEYNFGIQIDLRGYTWHRVSYDSGSALAILFWFGKAKIGVFGVRNDDMTIIGL